MKQQQSSRSITVILVVVLVACMLLSIRLGAVSISLSEMQSAFSRYFTTPDTVTLNERIFMTIRLPRAFLCVLVGASLAVGGTLMQALFRNPIVEPGLIGTSSGAAFGAAMYFALGAMFKFDTGVWTLPIAAGAGALLSTILVYILSLSGQTKKNSIVVLLLVGMAVNALFMSGVGFFSYIARDPQARSITFWGLGNLSGADWTVIKVVCVSTFGCITVAMRYAKDLNALMLGDDEAMLLGVNLKGLKVTILLINVVMIAVVTAFAGVISFVGLIVPHMLRAVKGADNRFLIPNSALLGGILLTLADLLARMLLRPAELPVGIVTSVIGVPIFIYLLRRTKYII